MGWAADARPPLAAPSHASACIVLALLLLGNGDGHAVCNVIPGTTQTFRASQTTIDRPFASPGDVLLIAA